MPRPKRGRPAPARASRAPPRSPSAEPEHDRDDLREQKGKERGRERTSQRAAGRFSVEEENAIRAVNLVRDAALERLANKDATTTGSSGNEREGSPGSNAETGRRVLATPAHRGDTTGLDLVDDSIFGNLDDSFADMDLPPGLRSTDTSIISVSNLRSRSRQGSFIGNTPGLASSFNIGAFRRRVREPSILGDSRKPLQEPPKNDTGARAESESEGEDEGEEDFEPEAESTPVNNRRKTRQSLELKQTTPTDSPGVTSSRKRKSEDTHNSSIRPDKIPRTESADQEVQDSDTELSDIPSPQQPGQDSDSELSDLPSPLEAPGFFQRAVTPIHDEEINAPPASSGSEGGDDIWPDIRVLAKKRRRPSITTPSKLDSLSDISSPPSLTHSPNFEETRGRGGRGRPVSRQQASPKLLTADLTNLLPKRRYKKARDPLGLESDEELDTTGLGDEDDELSYLDTQAARRRKGSRPPSRSTSARPASRGGRAAFPAAQKLKQALALAKSGPHHARSYSGQLSDKENEEESAQQSIENEDGEGEGEESRFVPLADDTFDTGGNPSAEVLSADELKKASRKFKEVDRWELDFEEVTRSSSPQDGR